MPYVWVLTLTVAVIALTIAIVALLQNLADRAVLADQVSRQRFERDHHRLDHLEGQVRMFFTLVERRLADLLHAPTHAAMDALLEKLRTQTITTDEAATLHVMLRERSDALVIEGLVRPDLQFPELFILWALEVRLLTAGYPIPSMTTPTRPAGGP